MNSLSFHPEIIRDCPPSDAFPANGLVFRMVKVFPPAAEDFASDVERKMKNQNRSNCNCWGCSVWIDENDVATAMNLFKHWRKRYIVSANLVPADGLVKSSPSDNQPGHHTFWKAVGIDLSARCNVFRSPDVN